MTTPSRPGTSGASRIVAILTGALGVAVIVGTVVGAVAPTIAVASATPVRSEAQSFDIDGIRDVDLDVSATAFTLRFDDVDEVTLDVRDDRGDAWTLRRDGETLLVASPDRPFPWFGRWFGGDDAPRATLTLPRALEGADVEVEFGAGTFEADGDFGAFDLQIGAGQASLAGSASALTVGMGAGRADIELDDVRTADLEVSAGAMEVVLAGTAPDEIDLSVSAGSLALTVPDDEYDVTSDVSAGDFTHDLRTATNAPHRLHAEVSAGDIRVTVSGR